LAQLCSAPSVLIGNVGVSANLRQVFIPLRIPLVPLVEFIVGPKVISVRIAAEQLKGFTSPENELRLLTFNLKGSLENN